MVKKYIFFPIFLLAVFSISFAQPPRDRHLLEDHDVRKFRIIRIKLLPSQEHIALGNIHFVTVVDARPDTIPVAFMQKHALNLAFVELDKSVRLETEEFVSDYLQLKKRILQEVF